MAKVQVKKTKNILILIKYNINMIFIDIYYVFIVFLGTVGDLTIPTVPDQVIIKENKVNLEI